MRPSATVPPGSYGPGGTLISAPPPRRSGSSPAASSFPLAVSLPVSLGQPSSTPQDELLTPLTALHTRAQDIAARLV